MINWKGSGSRRSWSNWRTILESAPRHWGKARKHESGNPVSRPRFKKSTYRIQVLRGAYTKREKERGTKRKRRRCEEENFIHRPSRGKKSVLMTSPYDSQRNFSPILFENRTRGWSDSSNAVTVMEGSINDRACAWLRDIKHNNLSCWTTQMY
jgi:hypothetical protein